VGIFFETVYKQLHYTSRYKTREKYLVPALSPIVATLYFTDTLHSATPCITVTVELLCNTWVQITCSISLDAFQQPLARMSH